MSKKEFLFYFFIFLLIVFRFLTSSQKFPEGQKIKITGKVLQEPARYQYSQKIFLNAFKIFLPNYPEIFYGDKIVVEGEVSGKELKNPKLLKKEESKSFLIDVKKRLLDFYESSLAEPYSSLIAGITLGSKGNISYQLISSLKKTGTMHVVVASGMNVTFVAGFLLSFFILFFPRRKAVILAVAGIWIYSFLVGFEAPIVRASLMISVTFIAQEFGKLTSAWRAFFLSALIMILIKPVWITDLGFILSFVATASLLLFQKRIEKAFKFIPWVLRESISTTIAAQIGVAPILFVTFGQFSILSVFANALVLWTVPLIMIIGLSSGILAVFIPIIGKLVLYLAYPLLFYFIKTIELFA